LRRVRAAIVAVENQCRYYATGMSYIIICGLSGSKHFPTSSHKRTIFEKKGPERKMSALILSTTFVQNTSHSKN
jgi:hypothetical protein